MKGNSKRIPRHVSIIMDGNRRWARKKGLSAISGHNYVVDEVIEPIVDRCIEIGVTHLTLWAFSTENFKRDKKEVSGLMRIFRKALGRKVQDLYEKGVRLNVIGDLSLFPKDIQKKSREWIEVSRENTKTMVTFALGYGGRDEIVRAANSAVEREERVDEEGFSKLLDTRDLPDVDLLIRTGGELRLSGFLPWQSTYAELYFTEVLMPDFSPSEFDRAIEEYGRRERRFGGGKFEEYSS